MSIVKFGDIVREVKLNVDRDNNPYEFYVAGEHMDTEDLTIRCKGLFATDDVGPAFTRIFKKGQILYGSRRTYLKKVAVADFDGICSNTTFVLESKNEHVFCQKLLPFIMLTDSFTKWSISHSKGSTNPYILFSDLANYVFELPSLDEQRVLADKLWAAYEVKESYKNLLAQTDKLLHAQFEKMFGNAETNGTIASLVYDNIRSVKKTYKPEDTISYIDISSVDAELNEVIATTDYLVSKAPSRAQQCVQEGDILVSTTRPINKNIAVIKSKAKNLVASTGFCVLRPKEEYRAYLLAIVKSDMYTKAMCDKATGGVYPAVNNSDVLSYKIVVPSPEVLQEVTSLAEQSEKTKASLNKGIEAIEAVIRSLIAEGTTKV